MKRIKLTFLDCKYSIHEENGVVIAKSSFNYLGMKFTTTGIARCAPDIFDINIGKKLARARAERSAYMIARNKVKEAIESISRSVELFNRSLDFFNDCILHQDNYIETF